MPIVPVLILVGRGTHNLSNDRTEDPEDVQFSDDGLRVFTINRAQQENLDLSMNTLSVPFDLDFSRLPVMKSLTE